ncbi:MAG: GGDEF domain-containing protein [Fuerstiella sp.]|nr:GGDEF domain-containing protein [Fuerstiella sp.]
MTGCLNRRSFFRDFEQTWEKSQVEGLPMAGVMVDIDHFKAVNDNHGHGVGDEVLRLVSAAVMKTVDPDDLVCRYGGEEFTILMPRTTLDEAEMKAEKCRLAIKALEFPKLSVTASLGVSALCQNPETPQDLLDQADKCLYVAKRNGRNQVVRWDRAQTQVANLSEETAPTREEENEKKAASAVPFHAVAAGASRPVWNAPVFDPGVMRVRVG